MEIKMELTAAYDRGEHGALTRVLKANPVYAAPLSEFAAALVATSGYESETPTPQIMALTQRATARAFASVFADAAVAMPASAVAPRAVASLKALRRARGVSLAALARQLGLGVDVLADVEAGVVRAASIPERFVARLGELLKSSAEQLRQGLETQPVLRPAFGRDPSSTQQVLERDFAEAVRLSTSMSPEQKREWLASL
jgi:transcriptional regulator with XRE-family HTH domain